MRTLLLFILLISSWVAHAQPAAGGSVREVRTLADLVALPIQTAGGQAQTIIVRDRTSRGDNGGGLFYQTNTVTSTNLGTRIASAVPGWSWQRIYEGAISPRWFGAKGDGATDDTTALQAAFNAAGTNAVRFSAGDYVASTLTVTNGNWFGDGIGNTTLRHKAATSGSLVQANTSFSVRGIKFDGQHASQTQRTNAAINFAGTGDLTVTDCWFYRTMYAGIKVPGQSRTLTITDNLFTDMAEHSGVAGEITVALYIEASPGGVLMFERNVVRQDVAIANAARAPGGILIQGETQTAPLRAIVRGNYFKNIGQRETGNFIGNIDIYSKGHDSIIEGNVFENYYYNPIKLANSSRLIVANNTINGAQSSSADHGITIQPRAGDTNELTGNLVIGNRIKLTGANIGIYIQGHATGVYRADSTLITGNFITNATSGIQVDYMSQADLTDNEIVGATLNGILISNITTNTPNLFRVRGGFIKASHNGVRYISDSAAKTGYVNVEGVTFQAITNLAVAAELATVYKVNENTFTSPAGLYDVYSVSNTTVMVQQNISSRSSGNTYYSTYSNLYEALNTWPSDVLSAIALPLTTFPTISVTNDSRMNSLNLTNDFYINGGARFYVRASDGRVGINTAAPTALLDVNGTSKFRNTVTVNDGATDQGFLTWDGSGANTFNLTGAANKRLSLGSHGIHDRFVIDINGDILAIRNAEHNYGSIANGGTVALTGSTNGSYAKLDGATWNLTLPTHPVTGSPAFWLRITNVVDNVVTFSEAVQDIRQFSTTTATNTAGSNGDYLFTWSTADGKYVFSQGNVTGFAFANPSGTIDGTAVNGVATTALRSDGRHALADPFTPADGTQNITGNVDVSGHMYLGPTNGVQSEIKLSVIGGMFGTDGSRAADPTSGLSAGMHWSFNASGSSNPYGVGISALDAGGKYNIWFQTGSVNGGGYRWYNGTSEKMRMDSGTFNLGIATTSPDRPIEVNSATGLGIRTTYNDDNGSAANYVDYQVTSSGDATITPSGGDVNVVGAFSASTLGTFGSVSVTTNAIIPRILGAVVITNSTSDLALTVQGNNHTTLRLDATPNNDPGFEFNENGALKWAFNYDSSADVLRWYSAATGANVFTLTDLGVSSYMNTTDSTSKDTGSAIFEGGVGVEKNIYAGGFISPGGLKRVSTQFDKTDDTLATVTGLSVTVAASTTYKFYAQLDCTLDTTDGGKYAIGGTATATAINYRVRRLGASSAVISSTRQTALGSAVNATATLTDDDVVIEGVITVNAGGTLVVQFAQQSNGAGTSSVLVGSTFEVTPIQ